MNSSSTVSLYVERNLSCVFTFFSCAPVQSEETCSDFKPTVTEDMTQQLHSQSEESRVSLLRRRAEQPHSDQTAYFLQTQAKPFMTAQETTGYQNYCFHQFIQSNFI